MTSTADLLVVVPLLGRPHRIEPLLASLRDATPEDYDVHLMTTLGDGQVYAAAIHAAQARANIVVRYSQPRATGEYAFKVNEAIRRSEHPFIFTGADDLAFRPGWWTTARAFLDAHPHVGVLGTNDLSGTERNRNGTHSTHFLVRREYAERGLIDGQPGLMYEGYPHEYVDDELVGTAKKRGAWAYREDVVVEHLHPDWGKAPTDNIYRQSQRRMVKGRPIFQRRRRLWT